MFWNMIALSPEWENDRNICRILFFQSSLQASSWRMTVLFALSDCLPPFSLLLLTFLICVTLLSHYLAISSLIKPSKQIYVQLCIQQARGEATSPLLLSKTCNLSKSHRKMRENENSIIYNVPPALPPMCSSSPLQSIQMQALPYLPVSLFL